MSDYVTDTKSVLDQTARVLQAMVDVSADGGWLHTALGVMHLTQMVTQARFLDDSQLADLPHMSERAERALAAQGVVHLGQLVMAPAADLRRWLRGAMDERQLGELQGLLRSLPSMEMAVAAPTQKLTVSSDGEIAISLRATNPTTRRNVYAPRFPKPVTKSGWWLAMGEGDELLALKRVHLERGSSNTTLAFLAPDEPGEYSFDVYLVSDAYIGLDQRHTVQVQVLA